VNNRLDEPPRIGRQPAERERFLKSSWNFSLNKKTAGKLAFLRVYLQLERLHDTAVNFYPF
jgi:hypothetical protein